MSSQTAAHYLLWTSTLTKNTGFSRDIHLCIYGIIIRSQRIQLASTRLPIEQNQNLMHTTHLITTGILVILTGSAIAQQTKMKPEETEIWDPEPRVVTTYSD